MTATVPQPSAGTAVPILSTRWTKTRLRTLVVTTPAEDHVFIDRHCQECGLLGPHHRQNCISKWEE